MWAFLLTPIGRLIAEIVAVIAIVGSLYGYMRVHYYNAGWTAAIHAVAAEDQKAVNDRNKALATVKACRARGGTWNVPDSMCE